MEVDEHLIDHEEQPYEVGGSAFMWFTSKNPLKITCLSYPECFLEERDALQQRRLQRQRQEHGAGRRAVLWHLRPLLGGLRRLLWNLRVQRLLSNSGRWAESRKKKRIGLFLSVEETQEGLFMSSLSQICSPTCWSVRWSVRSSSPRASEVSSWRSLWPPCITTSSFHIINVRPEENRCWFSLFFCLFIWILTSKSPNVQLVMTLKKTIYIKYFSCSQKKKSHQRNTLSSKNLVYFEIFFSMLAFATFGWYLAT